MATSISIRATRPQALPHDRVNMLGTQIDRVERSDVAPLLERFILSGKPHQIVTANLDFVAIARRRPEFARLIAGADLVLCDGKPLQWASRIKGEAIPARVTGMDLVLTTARLSAANGYRLYFMGGAPGVASRAARALTALVPGVVITGTDSPQLGHFDEGEEQRIVTRIKQAEPHALFVALGAPRQDQWIATHLDELGVPLCAGIGGVFNFLAGETKRAPEWIQHAGMEWAYRLSQEPSRLWKRYLVDDLPIFFHLITRVAGGRLRGASMPRSETHTGGGQRTLEPVATRTIPEAVPTARQTSSAAAKHGSGRRGTKSHVRGRKVRRTVARAITRG